MNVLDLFAGAGGISVGLKKAKFNIVLANEINKEFAYTYKKNHIETEMVCRDISDFVKSLSNYKNLTIDLVVGGPPCQGFSMAGARIRKKNTLLDDPRNFLFKKYFETVQFFEPKYFIFENVEGITTLNNGAFLNEIVNLFTDKNNFNKGPYFLSYKVLSVNDFGVPQRRKRFIMIGSKKPIPNLKEIIDSYLKQLLPSSKYKQKPNIRDAISDLNFLESGEGCDIQKYNEKPLSKYQKIIRGNQTNLYNHIATKHNKLALKRISVLKPGDSRKDLNDSNLIKSVHSGAYARMRWNEQAVTVTTRFDTPSGGKFIHPEKNRTITPREAARIQSFPDNFIFYGSKGKISTMIGNAVPPIFAEFLGELIKYIDNNY